MKYRFSYFCLLLLTKYLLNFFLSVDLKQENLFSSNEVNEKTNKLRSYSDRQHELLYLREKKSCENLISATTRKLYVVCIDGGVRLQI